MFKNLTRLLLIFALILTLNGCGHTEVKPTGVTITISQQEFEELKANVVKLGQDAKYYQAKYNDCLKSKQ